MGPPAASGTYRLQLRPGFGFEEARRRLPYLRALGIDHLYLSPIAASRRGSSHGYDVVDPSRPDAELGGREGLEALLAACRAAGVGVLLDIVPNHMAASHENPWWVDVLEHGPASPYASRFDIDWAPPGGPRGRLLLPVLGTTRGRVLASGALELRPGDGRLWAVYGDRRFPLEPGSWGLALGAGGGGGSGETHGSGGREGGAAPPRFADVPDPLRRILERLEGLPPFAAGGGAAARARRRRAADARGRLRRLAGSPAETWLRRRLEQTAATGPAGPGGRLDRLLRAQPYRLAHWRTGNRVAGYRRFFDIGHLVALRTERLDTFEAVHELTFRLARREPVVGVRVDHVDGLRDPERYLRRLRGRLEARMGGGRAPDRRPWILVEKILAPGEPLPPEWPVDGTTGYEHLAGVAGVLVDPEGVRRLEATYRRRTGETESFADRAVRRKRQVLRELFGGELRSLALALRRIGERLPGPEAPPEETLRSAILEVTACLDVYRTYAGGRWGVSGPDRRRLESAAGEARRRDPALSDAALRLLRRVLLLADPPPGERPRWLRFVRRWQQLSGPAAAKGVEDTAHYDHSALLSLAEVGGEPGALPTVEEFHAAARRRGRRWPGSLNPTSTHDTIRSGDVRARLHVLSELPDEWDRRLSGWMERNDEHRLRSGGRRVPSRNEEVHLYQTLVGAWPLRPAAEADVTERVRRYLRKALREAKVHTDWLGPDEAYEEAVLDFLDRILASGFRAELRAFVERIAPHGALNSLTQTLLSAVVPGVPDRYQGTEVWRLSLADPDNRRPVDFDRLRRLLDRVPEPGAPAEDWYELTEAWRDGRIKLCLVRGTLEARGRHPRLFRDGAHAALDASGPRQGRTVGVARRRGDRWIVAVAPRLTVGIPRDRGLSFASGAWPETRLRLPEEAPRSWSDLFTGRRHRAAAVEGGSALELEGILSPLPFALLRGD